MKTVLLSILLVCASLEAYSQKKVDLDVVYLKTDSILAGNIIYSVPGVSITLKTLNQEYLYILVTEIEQIKHEKYKSSNGTLIPIPADSLNTGSRYWFWLQGGGRIGLGYTKSERAQIDMINGFQTQSQLRLGIGIGARHFQDEHLYLVPIYLHLQTALSNGKMAPMAAIGAGMVSNPKSDWKVGGPFLRGDIGIQCDTESGGFFTLTIGFEQMNFYAQKSFYTEFRTANYFTVNLGIMI